MNKPLGSPALFLPALILLGHASCVVNRPRELGVVPLDETRGYIKVVAPYYKKKPTGFSHFTTLAFMGGGGYYGHQQYAPASAPDQQVRYGVLGAAGGFILSKLFLSVAGSGKKTFLKEATEVKPWLDLYNRRNEKDWIHVARSFRTADTILVVTAAVEPVFSPRSLEDVRNFNDAFPGSAYLDKVIESIIPRLSDDELTEMIGLFPAQRSILKAKVEFVNRSTSEENCRRNLERYPETRTYVENKYASLVATYPFAMDFIARYPGSRQGSEVFARIFGKLPQGELLSLLRAYPAIDTALSRRARIRYYERCSSLDSLQRVLAEFKDESFIIRTDESYETYEEAEAIFRRLDGYRPLYPGDSLQWMVEGLRMNFLLTEREAARGSTENTRNLFMTVRDQSWLKSAHTEPIISGIILDYCSLFGEEYFVGRRVRDQYEGMGTLFKPNGDLQRGHFTKGRLNGEATVIKKDGDRQEGVFVNGELNGRGRITDPAGRVVEGEFAGGDLTGDGRISFPDGSYQQGTYRQFRLNGQGEWHFPNGDHYKGQFENGRYSGRGEYHWVKEGLRYEGRFEGGKRKGFGTLYMPGGFAATGVWNNDCIDGEGIISQRTGTTSGPDTNQTVTVTDCQISQSGLDMAIQQRIHTFLLQRVR
jgi:hypothetical protein